MNPFQNIFKTFIIVLLFFLISYASQNSKNGSFDSAQVSKAKSAKAPSQIRFAEGQEVELATFWVGYSKKFNLSQNDELEQPCSKLPDSFDLPGVQWLPRTDWWVQRALLW